MTHQTLKNKETVPPGGFRFLQADTGVWIHAPSWVELIAKVKAHRTANSIPIGLEIEREIETQLCSTLPPGHCTYADDAQVRRAEMIARPTWQKYVEATKTLLEVVKVDGGIASFEEATEHSETCVRCSFNQSPEGCTGCNMQELLNLLATYSLRKTDNDSRLKGCLICGCALRAKIYVRGGIAAKVAAKYLDVLPAHCWVKKADEQ